jgi:hypothetical protein
VYCFVHAPVSNGWNGELLLVRSKDKGTFRANEIEKICKDLYVLDDFHTFHFDNNVSADRVSDYLMRRRKGMMQRISISGTYEDMHYDEWLRGISQNYFALAKFIEFIFATEEITN